MQNLGVVQPVEPVDVAQPPPAENPPQLAPVQYVCPECRRACKNVKSLGIHRRFSHGVKGMSGRARTAKHQKQKSEAQSGPRSRSPTLPLDSLFEFAAGQMQAQADLTVSCVRGLSVILEKSKELRFQYMKMRHELTKLQRLAKSSTNGASQRARLVSEEKP
jgi:hypothetical protein